jgi:hypothetical protein
LAAFDPGAAVSAKNMSFVGHSDMAGKSDGVQVMVHRYFDHWLNLQQPS